MFGGGGGGACCFVVFRLFEIQLKTSISHECVMNVDQIGSSSGPTFVGLDWFQTFCKFYQLSTNAVTDKQTRR